MSLGTIFQSIEILSKEKGIDPKIILDAVKDAMLVAARKHFHTDRRPGGGVRRTAPARFKFSACAKWWRKWPIADKEISLEDARDASIPTRRSDSRNPFRQTDRGAGPHFGADRQAGDSAKGPRSRARKYFFGIFRPRGRAGHLRRQARGRSGSDGGSGQDGSSAAEKRAVEARKFQRRRPHPLRDQERGKSRQERGRDCFARRAGTGDAPVRTGSARRFTTTRW